MLHNKVYGLCVAVLSVFTLSAMQNQKLQLFDFKVVYSDDYGGGTGMQESRLLFRYYGVDWISCDTWKINKSIEFWYACHEENKTNMLAASIKYTYPNDTDTEVKDAQFVLKVHDDFLDRGVEQLLIACLIRKLDEYDCRCFSWSIDSQLVDLDQEQRSKKRADLLAVTNGNQQFPVEKLGSYITGQNMQKAFYAHCKNKLRSADSIVYCFFK